MTTMVTVENSLPSEEAHFETLIESCKVILIERQFNARFEYMASRWEVGQLVSQYYERYKRDGMLASLSQQLSVGESELYRCVQFYAKFPALDWDSAMQKLPEGKNLSWNKVKTDLLPEKTSPQKKRARDIEGAIAYCRDHIGREWTQTDADQVSELLA